MTKHHRVTIETDQASGMTDHFSHFAAVTRRSNRAVDDDESGFQPQLLDDFSQQHGNMDRVCFTTGRTRLHNGIDDQATGWKCRDGTPRPLAPDLRGEGWGEGIFLVRTFALLIGNYTEVPPRTSRPGNRERASKDLNFASAYSERSQI